MLLSNHSSTASCGRDGLVEGTDTCGQRSNLEKVGYAPTGTHLLDRDSLGLENLGVLAPWFAGEGGGESHLTARTALPLINKMHLAPYIRTNNSVQVVQM